MKIEHELFAHHYILTGDKDKAYKAAYPEAEGKALKTAARRLINNPDVRKYIHEHLAADRQQAILIHQLTEQERADEEYASLMLQRKVLRKIITGEQKVRRHIRVKDHIEVVEDDMPPYAVIRSIEVDAKLTNEWYARHKNGLAEKPELTQEEKDKIRDKGFSLPLPPMREGHDVPLHLQHREMCEMGREAFLEKHFGPDYAAGLRALEVKEKPYMAENYKRAGMRVLDPCPTIEEMLEMRGVYARLRRQEEEKRKQQMAAKGTIANPDGTVPFPELYLPHQDEEPLSIPELYPYNDEYREKEVEQPPQPDTDYPWEQEGIHFEKPGINELPPATIKGDTYYPKGTPEARAEQQYLISKGVNPHSFPPPDPRPLPPEVIAQKLQEAYEIVSNDPNSMYYKHRHTDETGGTPPPAIQNDTE